MWKGREGLETRQRVVLERSAVRVRNDMLQEFNCLRDNGFNLLQRDKDEGCLRMQTQGGSYVTTAFISAMRKRHFSVTPAA